jgi:hypothetical protein
MPWSSSTSRSCILRCAGLSERIRPIGHELPRQGHPRVRSSRSLKLRNAGRIPPQEGLPFVLEKTEENDLITLGMGSVEEAAESLNIVETFLGKGA